MLTPRALALGFVATAQEQNTWDFKGGFIERKKNPSDPADTVRYEVQRALDGVTRIDQVNLPANGSASHSHTYRGVPRAASAGGRWTRSATPRRTWSCSR